MARRERAAVWRGGGELMFLVYSRHTFYTVSFLTFKNIIFSSIGNAFSEICAAAQRRRCCIVRLSPATKMFEFDKDHAGAATGGGDGGKAAILIFHSILSILFYNFESHL